MKTYEISIWHYGDEGEDSQTFSCTSTDFNRAAAATNRAVSLFDVTVDEVRVCTHDGDAEPTLDVYKIPAWLSKYGGVKG